MLAYQRHLLKECNFSSDVVHTVETYRNAVNYVVIFLDKPDATDEQFGEIVQMYGSQLSKFDDTIRKMTVTRNLSRLCYNSLKRIQRAVKTTGEGLVAGTMLAFNSRCTANRVHHTTTPHSIEFISNSL